MQTNSVSSVRRTAWKATLTRGLYKTGALSAIHSLARYYEVINDGGGRRRLQRVRKGRYLILAYHRIGTEGPPLYSALPQVVFAEQMRFLRQHYRVLSLKQMLEELQDPSAPGQAVVVTFDDGYAGTFTDALPVLQAYKIPATVYLIGEAIETGELSWYDKIFLQFQRVEPNLTLNLDGPRSFILPTKDARLRAAETVITHLRTLADNERQQWCAEFERLVPLKINAVRGAMMTWDDIRTMRNAGICFGAHTMTHPVVSRLSPGRLYEEIAGSKNLIEQRLNGTVDEFAYPFGKSRDCSTAAADLLKHLGFAAAATSIVGMNRPGDDPYRLRRMAIDNDRSIARFALKLHRIFFCPWDEEVTAS